MTARLGGRKFFGLMLCTGVVAYLVTTDGDTGNITVAIGAITGMYTVFCGGNAYVEKLHKGNAA
jgi:hypothetical protein